jgi:peptide/nickel transport system substrate-binding protein
VGGAPQIARLEVRTVRDETTRVLELLKGRADLAINAVSPQLLSTLQSSANVRVERVPGSGYAYLLFNLRDPALQDRRLRQAISCALTREEITRYKFEGTATPATGMLPRSHWAYSAGSVCDDDLGNASRLLDALNLPDPGHGRPRLTLSYKSSTDRFRKSVAEVIAAQERRAGVELDLKTLEFGTFSRDVKEGNFQVATLKWSAVIEPDLLRWVYDSHFVPSAANEFEGLNREEYANPAFDELVERATTVLDLDARGALYRQAQSILAEDLPVVPLWHEDVVVVHSAALQGFRASPHGWVNGLAHARKREATP